MSGFAFSYTANIFNLMILYDLCLLSCFSYQKRKLDENLTFKWHSFELGNSTELRANNWGVTTTKYINMVRKYIHKVLKCLLLYVTLLKRAAQSSARLNGHHICKPSSGASVGITAKLFLLPRSGNLPKRFKNVNVYLEKLFETDILQDMRYSQQCLWRVLFCRIWGIHSNVYRGYYLLWCDDLTDVSEECTASNFAVEE
jgi:hypothetical protein